MMMMTITLNFLMRQLRPQMTMSIMNLDPKIQFLQFVILQGHKSQEFHNFRLFKGAKNLSIWCFAILTHKLNLICKSTW
jgi:hypothetical protein